MRPDRAGSRWQRAVREHRAALAAFGEVVRGIDEVAWRRPVGEGKWSPAQIAEHLLLTHQAVLDEMETGRPMAPRAGRALQAVLRWVMLPHLLFHRSIPVRARAPREVRPSGEGLEAEMVVARMQALGGRVEEALGRRRDAHVTHPYFGPITARRALRFLAAHIEHHLRQIDPGARPGR